MNSKSNLLIQTPIYDLTHKRLKELTYFEKNLMNSLSKAPEGSIHVAKKKSGAQYYLRYDANDKTGVYLRKDKQKIIKAHLQKAYDQKVLKLVQEEIKALNKYVGGMKSYDQKIKSTYSNEPDEIKELITPIDCSDEDYAKFWLSIPFEANPFPKAETEFKSLKGEFVRSKSELNIADALTRNNIPYKYECPKVMKNGMTVYPDFTTLRLSDRSEIYWEHRGMMDDRDYLKGAIKKNKEYIRNGIIPGKNLIITEESLSMPLGTDEIKSIISWLKE